MNVVQDVRMHGASNQFLIHFGDETPEECLKKLDGADGLLIIQEDEQSDAFMRIFNADGSEAEQCGNGLRCVALHLVRNKMVETEHVSIRTLAGVCDCVVREDCNEVAVTMCKPTIETRVIEEFPTLLFVNTGNPNAVYWTENDPLHDREQLGERISNHPQFSEGLNVHFARRDAKQYATCASWERGVGPTHASGTGGAAVFVSSQAEGIFFVSSQGGTLQYEVNPTGIIVMSGPAGYV
jgi:diaminopimelate epimerase